MNITKDSHIMDGYITVTVGPEFKDSAKFMKMRVAKIMANTLYLPKYYTYVGDFEYIGEDKFKAPFSMYSFRDDKSTHLFTSDLSEHIGINRTIMSNIGIKNRQTICLAGEIINTKFISCTIELEYESYKNIKDDDSSQYRKKYHIILKTNVTKTRSEYIDFETHVDYFHYNLAKVEDYSKLTSRISETHEFVKNRVYVAMKNIAGDSALVKTLNIEDLSNNFTLRAYVKKLYDSSADNKYSITKGIANNLRRVYTPYIDKINEILQDIATFGNRNIDVYLTDYEYELNRFMTMYAERYDMYRHYHFFLIKNMSILYQFRNVFELKYTSKNKYHYKSINVKMDEITSANRTIDIMLDSYYFKNRMEDKRYRELTRLLTLIKETINDMMYLYKLKSYVEKHHDKFNKVGYYNVIHHMFSEYGLQGVSVLFKYMDRHTRFLDKELMSFEFDNRFVIYKNES